MEFIYITQQLPGVARFSVKIVGLEQGPISLLMTVELLERKVAAPV
jgi:hypothetical protein